MKADSTEHNLSMKLPDSNRQRAIVWANKSQVSSLNRAFNLNNRPEKSDLEELAKEVGLDSKWIARWFIRKRRDARNALAKLSAADFESTLSSRTSEAQSVFFDNDHGAGGYASLTRNILEANSNSTAEPLATSPQCIHGPLCSWCRFDPPLHSNVFARLGFSSDINTSAQFVNSYADAANSVTPYPDRNDSAASSNSVLKVPSLTFGYIPLAFPAFSAPQNSESLVVQANGPAGSSSLGLTTSTLWLRDKYCTDDNAEASHSTGGQRDSVEKLKALSRKPEISGKFGTQNTISAVVSPESSEQGYHNHQQNNKVAYL